MGQISAHPLAVDVVDGLAEVAGQWFGRGDAWGPGADLNCQVPVRSVAAYFFQGRVTMSGKSIRNGAGTSFIM